MSGRNPFEPGYDPERPDRDIARYAANGAVPPEIMIQKVQGDVKLMQDQMKWLLNEIETLKRMNEGLHSRLSELSK